MGKIKRKHWIKLFSFLKWIMKKIRPNLGSLFIVEALMTFSSVAVISFAVFSQKIIDAASSGEKFLFIVILYLIVTVLNQAASMIKSIMTLFLKEKIGFGIRKEVFSHILKGKWRETGSIHTGDLNTRITSDCDNIASGVVDVFPGLSVLIIDILITFFTLYRYSISLAFFSLLFAPVGIIFSFVIGGSLRKIQKKLQKSESKYRSFIQESLSNLLIVKAFKGEEYASDRLEELKKDRFFWVKKKSRINMISSNAIEISFNIGYMVAFLVGVIGISKNTITYGGMTVFLMLVNRIQGPLMEMMGYLPKMASIISSGERIREIESIKEEIALNQTRLSEKIDINIKNVTFAYDEEIILENIDIDIKNGEFIGIMGESGIGKTTFIRLIMGFLEPLSGEMTLSDKENINEIDGGSRKYMSYVPQGNTVFSGTIADALRLGKKDATEEEIIDALKKAQIYDAIIKLPDGINSYMGEKGNGFSEGQIQRIAIARALVKKAPILILDEATSGLDEKTEIRVLQEIKSLDYKPICLFISHRKSILEYCDRYITINDKKINKYTN